MKLYEQNGPYAHISLVNLNRIGHHGLFFPQRMSITDYTFGTQSNTSQGKYYDLFKTHAIVSTATDYLSSLGIAESSIIIA